MIAVIILLSAFSSQDLIRNSPYWLPFNYYDVFKEFCIVSTSVDNSLIDISRYSQNSSLLDVVLMLLEEILPWSGLKVAATRLRNGSEIQRLHSGRKSTNKGDPTERLNPINMTVKIYQRLFKLFQFLSTWKTLLNNKKRKKMFLRIFKQNYWLCILEILNWEGNK